MDRGGNNGLLGEKNGDAEKALEPNQESRRRRRPEKALFLWKMEAGAVSRVGDKDQHGQGPDAGVGELEGDEGRPFGRQNLPEGEWEIRDGQAGAAVPGHRADDDL